MGLNSRIVTVLTVGVLALLVVMSLETTWYRDSLLYEGKKHEVVGEERTAIEMEIKFSGCISFRDYSSYSYRTRASSQRFVGEWAIQDGKLYLTKLTDDYGKPPTLWLRSPDLVDGRLYATWYTGKMWNSTLYLWGVPILPFGKASIFREFTFAKGRLVSTRITWDWCGVVSWLAKVVVAVSLVALVVLLVRRIRQKRSTPPSAEENMMKRERARRMAHTYAWMTFGIVPIHFIGFIDTGCVEGGLVTAIGALVIFNLWAIIFCLQSGKQKRRFLPCLIGLLGCVINVAVFMCLWRGQ